MVTFDNMPPGTIGCRGKEIRKNKNLVNFEKKSRDQNSDLLLSGFMRTIRGRGR